MRSFWRKPGAAAIALAVVMLLQLAAAFVFLRATDDEVWLGSKPLGGACYFRQHTGLPCPTCGMTRSVVLSLHGEIGAALRLNPAGPVWVLAQMAIAAGLLWLAWRQRTQGEAQVAARRVQWLALAHGGALGLVLVAHWVRALVVRG